MNLKEFLITLKEKFKSSDQQAVFVRNMILLIILGMGFLFFSNLFQPLSDKTENQKKPDLSVESVSFEDASDSYASLLENKLEAILSQMEGAGEVQVVITLKTGPKYEYVINRDLQKSTIQEDDYQGGQRSTEDENISEELASIRTGSNEEEPVLIQRIKPEIQGVIIAAQGASNSRIRAEINQAAQAFLNIPAYRVNILTKKR